ncbi:hypothetical protein [Mycobacterium sp. SA01]|uniref:hypothetical protein n=1 Tax=Mycobacterium sp. SA01 TaxID=3238820 RepID=UPI00351BEAC4
MADSTATGVTPTGAIVGTAAALTGFAGDAGAAVADSGVLGPPAPDRGRGAADRGWAGRPSVADGRFTGVPAALMRDLPVFCAPLPAAAVPDAAGADRVVFLPPPPTDVEPDSSAQAIGGTAATAPPIPSATASAPTRPMCLANPSRSV